MSLKVQMVFGTRPEAIKMAPLARVLKHWPGIDLFVCSTGQHREMLQQVLDAFELQVDDCLLYTSMRWRRWGKACSMP